MTVEQHQDVVGRHVAVVGVLAVQDRQRLGHVAGHLAQPGLARRDAQVREPLLEREPLVERHHHVGGAHLFPVAKHLQQRRMVERREQARLLDEAAQPELEVVLVARRARHDDTERMAQAEGGRHVLLDRDRPVEQRVVHAVDDAVATDADDVLHHVFLQPMADLQRAVDIAPRHQHRALVVRAARVGQEGLHRHRKHLRVVVGSAQQQPGDERRGDQRGDRPDQTLWTTARSCRRAGRQWRGLVGLGRRRPQPLFEAAKEVVGELARCRIDEARADLRDLAADLGLRAVAQPGRIAF